jgi:hypothetical protein
MIVNFDPNQSAMAGLQGFSTGQQVREMQTNRRIGEAINSGNLQGAEQAANRAGNFDLAAQIRERAAAMSEAERQTNAQNLQSADQYLVALGGIGTQDEAVATFDSTVGGLIQRGIIQPEDAARYRQLIDTPNYRNNITAIRGVIGDSLPEFMQPTTLANNEVLADPLQGQTQNQTSVRLAAEDERSNRVTEALRGREVAINESAEQRAVTELANKLENGEPASSSDIRALRNEFEDNYARPFEEAQDQFLSMERLAGDQTGASDTALIFSFFKTIDPSSTVREGEFALAAQSMGLTDRLQAQMQRVDNGQILIGNARQELVNAARRAIEQRAETVASAQSRYTELAQLANADPRQVVRDPISESFANERRTFTNENGETVIILDE